MWLQSYIITMTIIMVVKLSTIIEDALSDCSNAWNHCTIVRLVQDVHCVFIIILTWYKWHRSGVVSRDTDTSWVDSSHTPHILVTLWWWWWWVYTCDVVSGESDVGIRGGEHSHHTSFGVGHSDCVDQLYPIRSPWRRPAEHQYTIWYWLWWQIAWLWGGTWENKGAIIHNVIL